MLKKPRNEKKLAIFTKPTYKMSYEFKSIASFYFIQVHCAGAYIENGHIKFQFKIHSQKLKFLEFLLHELGKNMVLRKT